MLGRIAKLAAHITGSLLLTVVMRSKLASKRAAWDFMASRFDSLSQRFTWQSEIHTTNQPKHTTMYFSFNAVSACRGAFDRNTNEQSLIDWLENVRPTHADVQRNKKALPAIMPHGLFMSRKKDSLARHSGLVQVDIDGKHQAEPKSWKVWSVPWMRSRMWWLVALAAAGMVSTS